MLLFVKIYSSRFKIIDDDLDLTKLRALETDELDIYGEGEDAPQVAGIIDDRPEELKKLEQFKTTTKWRVINQVPSYFCLRIINRLVIIVIRKELGWY